MSFQSSTSPVVVEEEDSTEVRLLEFSWVADIIELAGSPLFWITPAGFTDDVGIVVEDVVLIGIKTVPEITCCISKYILEIW